MIDITLVYNKSLLIKEGEQIGYMDRNTPGVAEKHPMKYQSGLRWNDLTMDDIVLYPEIDSLRNQIEKMFLCKVWYVAYYKMIKGERLPKHRDPYINRAAYPYSLQDTVPHAETPRVSVNVILTENTENEEYLQFEIDGLAVDAPYQAALFNASKVTHFMSPVSTERVIARFFIDKSFENCIAILQNL